MPELNLTRWTDWYAAVDRALRHLRERCPTVFVAGLSMGATLALRLAEEHGDAVAGLVLVNPVLTSKDRRLLVLPLLRLIVASLGAIGNDVARPGVQELA